MTMTTKAFKTVSIESNIRDWVYTAYIGKTGRLLSIRAGCRTWKDFTAARHHYYPDDPHARWGSLWLKNNTDFRAYAWHLEARAILQKLQNRVRLATEKIESDRRRQTGARSGKKAKARK